MGSLSYHGSVCSRYSQYSFMVAANRFSLRYTEYKYPVCNDKGLLSPFGNTSAILNVPQCFLYKKRPLYLKAVGTFTKLYSKPLLLLIFILWQQCPDHCRDICICKEYWVVKPDYLTNVCIIIQDIINIFQIFILSGVLFNNSIF